MKNWFPSLLILQLLFCISCSQNAEGQKGNTSFNSYWYQGKAEITSYELEQARYGEIHKGTAVLIFVTEPFSKSKQVKLDNAPIAGDDAEDVLKLNFTKKFNTGIYPYSIMNSVFTPTNISGPGQTLKITSSSQEWCGHTFMQLNNQNDEYQVELKSYFETEGDQTFSTEKVYLEDEIWNMIRINPHSLPVGNVKMIPGMIHLRLRHEPFKVQRAIISKGNLQDDQYKTYLIKYPEINRTIKIFFSPSFPYEIAGWEEIHLSGFGSSAKPLTTKATKKKTMLLDYWNKNSVEDTYLKKELELE